MPAFTRNAAHAIENTITALCNRTMAAVITMPAITYQQLLNMVADEQDHAILKQARSVLGLGYLENTSIYNMEFCQIGDRQVLVTFKTDGYDASAPALPQRPKNYTHREPEIERALITAAGQLIDIMTEWARVKAVFTQLNELCSSPSQVRYYWPSILGILAHCGDDYQTLRSSIITAKPHRTSVQLPMGVREGCRKTAQTVAMATLLPAEIPTPEKGPVRVEFGLSTRGPVVNENGLKFWLTT